MAIAFPASALAVAPTNDNYLSSWRIPDAQFVSRFRPVPEVTRTVAEDTTGTTTQPDLFNPNSQGLAFGGGGSEPLACNHVRYGSTIWYDLHPDVPMGVQLIASGYPSAIAIYEYNARTAQLSRKSVLCQTAGTDSNTFTVPGDLKAGKAYTVQVGGLQNGAGFSAGPLQLTTNLFPDHDADGQVDGVDKCPFLQGVLRFGGCPPTISPRASYNYKGEGSGLRLTDLIVSAIPGGARVEARCRQCGARQVQVAGPRADSVTFSRFAGLSMPAGAHLEIWVTKSAVTGKAGQSSIYRFGAIGFYVNLTVKSAALDSRVLRCLMPGSLKPRRSCP
ncbi:MAG TPA: hypothetical protein VGF91_17065 [Solirubrobacteraceae bacterium]